MHEGTVMSGKADAPSSSSADRIKPAAARALAEASARRAEVEAKIAAMPRELGGRGGSEPVRYGDWEVKGLATDF